MIDDMTNIPVLSPEKIVDTLSNMYINVINKGVDLAVLPSVMMHGAPGVGKSQSVREIASRIEKSTGKRVNITDVRLILFNPVDLRGIPTSNAEKTLAIWLKPKIFDMDPSDKVINILFLDEISAAPQSVQAAAYQITLDKRVGEHALPKNCIVIAAGNRVTDKSVAYNMPKALANRLLHMEMNTSFKSWNKWAIENGINPKVLGFLKYMEGHLMDFDPKKPDLAFATPRSWEMVSNILNNVSDDVEKMFPLIAGLIGNGTAVEFKTRNKVYGTLPDIEGIFNGTETRVPKSSDTLYALVSAIIEKAREYKDDLVKIENSVDYGLRLPPDFSVILFKDLMYLEPDYRSKLLKMDGFKRWLESKGKLLNAVTR